VITTTNSGEPDVGAAEASLDDRSVRLRSTVDVARQRLLLSRSRGTEADTAGTEETGTVSGRALQARE
jgi:hypothetical protein